MRHFFFKKNGWRWMVGLVLFAAAGCGIGNDVDFARTVFSRLVKGLYAVRPMIDWDHFKAMQEDIGAQHRAFTDPNQKADYERLFIDGFKRGFALQKGSPRLFHNWRLLNTPGSTWKIAAVDNRAGVITLLFVIKKEGGQRLLTEIIVIKTVDRAKLEASAEAYIENLSKEK